MSVGEGAGEDLPGPIEEQVVIAELAGRREPNRDDSQRGPETPPSLRTRQKWIAMKTTMMNGRNSTCATYHRNKVLGPISLPSIITNRNCSPNTGVYPAMLPPTVTAHSASWSHGNR